MDPSVTIDEYDKWKSVYMDVFGEAP
jgi:hypothetical protein